MGANAEPDGRYPEGGETRPRLLDLLYAGYPEWRRSFQRPGLPAEHEVFAREMERLGAAPPARILEVGFGEGLFLDWARQRGYEIEGVEPVEEFADAARGRGHRVWRGTIGDVPAALEPGYDAIVCFDVLEHLSGREIVEFFLAAKAILKDEGAILARFPNGGSPFGRVHQYGDATHRTVLTASKVDQLALPAGLRTTGAFNAARMIRGGRFLGLPRRLAALAAAAIEVVVGLAYFGTRVPLDPNLVVHIRHARARIGGR